MRREPSTKIMVQSEADFGRYAPRSPSDVSPLCSKNQAFWLKSRVKLDEKTNFQLLPSLYIFPQILISWYCPAQSTTTKIWSYHPMQGSRKHENRLAHSSKRGNDARRSASGSIDTVLRPVGDDRERLPRRSDLLSVPSISIARNHSYD